MISSIFISSIVKPFYNALIFLVDFITNDLGLAIIILTIVFRFIIFPLSKNQIKTQIKMKDIQKPLKELKEKYKDNPQVMAQKMMELYKEHDIKPFSGILLMFIQLPLLFGFYYMFLRAGLPQVNPDLIYSFIPTPENIDTIFLGIELTTKSIILALIASVTQYFQARLLLPKKDDNKPESGSIEEIMQGVQTQMVYVIPIIILFVSYSFGAIIALYFVTSNIFSIIQEYYLKKTIKDKKPKEGVVEVERV
jgi:YidC/Oxa1 family membrane protein insertase